MQVTAEEINIIARLVYDLCGIVLDQSKGYLIESRLSGIAEKAGCKTFSELYYKARYNNDREFLTTIVDAITTQETLFFRDNSPYEALQYKVFPHLIDVKAGTSEARKIRIWSAACSTGQEPYSIAMVLREMIPDIDAWNIQILATDISDAAIQKASRGVYAAYEIQRGLKPEFLDKYFTAEGNTWKINDPLRAMVAFRKINLLEPFVGIGPFDIIFCRNVAIYFNQEDKAGLFKRLAGLLQPQGFLFVGSSESLSDIGPEFKPQHHCRSIFYQPNLPAASTLIS